MNMYDSEVAEGLLKNEGYQLFHEVEGQAPSQKMDPDADIYLMNTCSVREHAEDRVFSRLGVLSKIKKNRPDLIVGLMGCMVEEHKEKLLKRFPALDLMVGTRNLKDLPSLIEEVRQTRQQVSSIHREGISIEYTDLINRHGKFHAWLPIMTGCNKVCTFCIVPITRGAEVSMAARDVYREASRLANEGVKWITLLGQNVNSYQGNSRGVNTFAELLNDLCQIEGIARISFTTSHPHDATEDLYRVIAANSKISRRFHLPLQSGSDRVLKRMKRLHTFDQYKEKINLMRSMIPDVSITTDIIAGFSGETKEDHEETRKALEEVRYDGAYIYKYSVRPGTPAAKLADDVPFEEKEKRNAELLEVQKKITEENNRNWMGRKVNVFAEEVSSRNPKNLVGRTRQEKKIVFEAPGNLVGQFCEAEITDLKYDTFVGKLISASTS